MATVSDLMHHFCPFLTVREQPEMSDADGVFRYSATEAKDILVRDLDATDSYSLSVALHEIAHYLRYTEGVPVYRLPHKTEIERAVEEILTDLTAVHRLAKPLWGPFSWLTREVALHCEQHVRVYIRQIAEHYILEGAPEEFVRYEIIELLDAAGSTHAAEMLIDCILRAMEKIGQEIARNYAAVLAQLNQAAQTC